jgi:hypothetical protein
MKRHMSIVECGSEDENDHVFKEQSRLKSEHMFIYLLISFISIPTCTMIILKGLNCQSLKDGSSFLRMDSSIDCGTTSYKLFAVFDILLLFACQGIPLFWLVTFRRLSLRFRSKEADRYVRADANLWLAKRTGDPVLAPFSFLWGTFKINEEGFDIVDMLV